MPLRAENPQAWGQSHGKRANGGALRPVGAFRSLGNPTGRFLRVSFHAPIIGGRAP